MEDLWNIIKCFYIKTFGVSSEMVEMMASDNILLLSASGVSNSKISEALDIEMDSVITAICTYLSNDDISFSGWEESLKVNPFAIYQMLILLTGDDDYNLYKAEILSMDSSILEDIIHTSYMISKLYFDIDCVLDEEWK